MSNHGIPAKRFGVRRLAVIGVGLIGGSLALALKRQKLVGKVIGAGRSRANLELALRLGVIDEIADDAASAAEKADVIILAAPVNAMAGLFELILPALTPDKIVTDVGSVKAGVCEAASAILGSPEIARFVPGHPVAGKEHSGVDSASADLFENHNVVLTPLASTDTDALELIRRMWAATGARVGIMEVELHDRILAVTSHLPHVLAYAMVDLFADPGGNPKELPYRYEMAAGGFYDFTRTASGNPQMWRDICLMNRAQMLRHIDRFSAHLGRIRQMIDESDSDALERLFGAAKETRSMVAERRKPRS